MLTMGEELVTETVIRNRTGYTHSLASAAVRRERAIPSVSPDADEMG
jgi:hypothetical protein